VCNLYSHVKGPKVIRDLTTIVAMLSDMDVNRPFNDGALYFEWV
jgi:hypothetical protein